MDPLFQQFGKLPKPLKWLLALAAIGGAFYMADYLFGKFSEHLK